MTKKEVCATLFRLFRSGVLPPNEQTSCVRDAMGAAAPRRIPRKPTPEVLAQPSVEESLTEPSPSPCNFRRCCVYREHDSEVATFEAKKSIPPGTMLFVGWSQEAECNRHYKITQPSPFNRAMQAVLAQEDPGVRARGLISLASRISFTLVKNTLLMSAQRLARRSPDREAILLQIATVAATHGAVASEVGIEPAAEPSYDEGPFRGRFVMMRTEADKVIGRFSARVLPPQGTDWRFFWTFVRFPSDVEVVPTLLRRSADEAGQFDPASKPCWQGWVNRVLPGNPVLASTLLSTLNCR